MDLHQEAQYQPTGQNGSGVGKEMESYFIFKQANLEAKFESSDDENSFKVVKL